MCVFLSLYYLEDHRDSLACRGGNKDNVESYETLLKSHPANQQDSQDPGSIREMLAENLELQRTVNRLANFGPQTDRSGHLNSLKEQRLEYIQVIKAENAELKRTIKVLANLGSFKGIPRSPGGLVRSWQERSLKYITGESPRSGQKDYERDIYPSQETAALFRDTALSCREISQIEIKEELGRGYTKLTQRGVYNGRDVAVKSVGLDSTDLRNCVSEKRAKLAADCLLFSRYKVMKELLLYQQLNHPNVVKVSCSIYRRGLYLKYVNRFKTRAKVICPEEVVHCKPTDAWPSFRNVEYYLRLVTTQENYPWIGTDKNSLC
jgi:hypothetical protein